MACSCATILLLLTTPVYCITHGHRESSELSLSLQQYVTVLHRARSGQSQTSTQSAENMNRHARVSTTKLQALKSRQRLMTQKKRPSEQLARTILQDAGAEFLGMIGLGTTYHPQGCQSMMEVRADGTGTACEAKVQQMLRVVYDTGSTNLWMASDLCLSGPCASVDRSRYNSSLSETYRAAALKTELKVRFGTASLKGPIGIDDFHVGPFTVKSQEFCLIREESGPTFTDMPLEGIVGLGFPSLSAQNTTPFFDTVIKQNLLSRNMFAFYLTDAAHKDGQSPVGAILWGGVDRRLYDGPLLWFPVTQPHYWAIDLYDFKVGNHSLPISHDWIGLWSLSAGGSSVIPGKLILDTGTSYYTAGEQLHRAILRVMPTLHCSELDAYPDLTYSLKDVNGQVVNLVLTPEDYMVSDGVSCDLGFMQLDVPKQYGPAMILGELFLRKYFTVFDRGDGSDGDAKIGFAKTRHVEVDSLLGSTSSSHRAVEIGEQGNVHMDVLTAIAPIERIHPVVMSELPLQ